MTTGNSASHFSDEAAAAYLAGIIDGEGCVCLWVLKSGRNAGSTRRVVTIGMTDKPLVDLVGRLYDQLGITYSRHDRSPGGIRRHVWTISVQSQASLERLAAIVPIQHPQKIEKLKAVLASFVGRGRRPKKVAA